MDVVRRAPKACVFVAALVLPAAASTTEKPQYCGTKQWQPQIEHAAARFALPEQWLNAVILSESGGCTEMNGSPIVSSAGAMGLMQLMPNTWKAYRETLQLGDDPHDSTDNIVAGSAYLRDLYDRYGWPAAAAAYHAGPTHYDEHPFEGRALPRTTLNYLAHVERLVADQAAVRSADRTLFLVRSSLVAASDRSTNEARPDDVFVTLRHTIEPRTADEKAPVDVPQ